MLQSSYSPQATGVCNNVEQVASLDRTRGTGHLLVMQESPPPEIGDRILFWRFPTEQTTYHETGIVAVHWLAVSMLR